MSDATTNSYDDLPYTGHATRYTHPDNMAAYALLHGLRAPLSSNCRVLEIGCASASNLLPMAYSLPNSQFVGIDYSSRQIELGKISVHELGLNNIQLHATSVADVDESFGQFDYIICHGVFSWVTKEIQDHILRVIQQRLSPNGVAYVSYNTYPGWQLRGLARDILFRRVNRHAPPATQVAQARAYLDFLVKGNPLQKSAFAQILREEEQVIKSTPDYYIFHEHLEEQNIPLYFDDFANRAMAFGMQYLSEAKPNHLTINITPETQAQLQRTSTSRVDFEQQLDYLCNRMFRQTLICRSNVAISARPNGQALREMFFTVRVTPKTTPVDLQSKAEVNFAGRNSVNMAISNPFLKAVFVALNNSQPRVMGFKDTVEAAYQLLGAPSDLAQRAKDEELLVAALASCQQNGVLDLYVEDVPYTTTISERPRASAVARYYVKKNERPTNLRHWLVDLSDLEKVILPLLDGNHTHTEIRDAVTERFLRGELSMAVNGQALTSREEIDKVVDQSLPVSLRRMASQILIEA